MTSTQTCLPRRRSGLFVSPEELIAEMGHYARRDNLAAAVQIYEKLASSCNDSLSKSHHTIETHPTYRQIVQRIEKELYDSIIQADIFR